MTDQQILRYRQWLDEGVAHLEPMPTRPGWQWFVLRQGTMDTRVRALGPKDAKRLGQPSEPGGVESPHPAFRREAAPLRHS